jgi:hypothetical protein
MKIFDSTGAKFIKIDDSIYVNFPIEYLSLEGFNAMFYAAVENNSPVFIIKPDITGAVKETISGTWSSLRTLFFMIGDIGEEPPWDDIHIVWHSPASYEEKVPISSEEILEHRRLLKAIKEKGHIEGNKDDVRKSIHDTMTKLCELASRKLGFKDRFFSAAFGDSVAKKYSLISCMYGTYDVVCEIFSEEFSKVNDDVYWEPSSPKSQQAVLLAYNRIKFLESNRLEFEKERARVQKKWGFPLRTA